MSANSKISWTTHTFNPWWGCVKVSAGCQNCYAETFSKRTGHNVWGPAKTTPRRFFGDTHWAEPLKWNAAAAKAGERHRVFCASMADVFEDHPDVGPHRARLFALIEATPDLDWLLLTKRPERVADEVPGLWSTDWPDNAWLGTSVEDQAAADERIPHLLSVPATVRFLSCEPLLGPVDLSRWLAWRDVNGEPWGPRDELHWVIAGGESGPRHRPLNLDWARSLRDQCAEAGVAFFFKQVGGRWADEGGDLLDGREHKAFPEPAL